MKIPKRQYLFDPNELHAIAKRAVDLDRKTACAQIVSELRKGKI